MAILKKEDVQFLLLQREMGHKHILNLEQAITIRQQRIFNVLSSNICFLGWILSLKNIQI